MAHLLCRMKRVYTPWRNLVLLLVPMLLAGCRDEVELRCADENIIRLNPDAMAYFYFKPGTWWLYEQEGTGLTDSIWVSRSSLIWDNNYGKEACQCGFGKCIELASVRLENRAYNGEDYLFSYSLSSSFDDGQTTLYGSPPGFRSGFSPLSGHWLFLGKDQLINGNSGWSAVEAQDTLTVRGNLFKDILHWYVPSGDLGSSWQHEVWFARDHYIVRYKRYDSTIWNLVGYHIVR